MSNLYSYLTDEERDFLYENSTFEYEFSRNLAMMEAAEKQFDLECMNIDLQILKENGTVEDMEEMYTEAKEQKDQKTAKAEGGIINAIKRFINSVFDKLGKVFNRGKENPKVEVALPDTPANILSALQGSFNSAKNIVSGFFMKTNSDGTQEISKIKAILATLSCVAAIGGTYKFSTKNKKTGKTIKVSLSSLTEALPKLNQFKNDVINWMSGLFKKKDGSADDKNSSKFAKIKELVQPFFNILSGFGGVISSAINKVTNKNSDENTETSDGVEEQPAENTTESSIDDLNGDFESFYEYESFDADTDELINIIDSI